MGDAITQLAQDQAAIYAWFKQSSTQTRSWSATRVFHNVQSLKSMQDNLAVLGTIVCDIKCHSLPSTIGSLLPKAVFLAGVQVQAITFSYQSNSTKMQNATNALFFAGLFLGILGACIAFTGVIQLQIIHALLVRQATSISSITEALGSDVPNSRAVLLSLRFLQMMSLQVLGQLCAWDHIAQSLERHTECVHVELRQLLGEDLFRKISIHAVDHRITSAELASLRTGVRRWKTSFAFSAYDVAPVVVFMGTASFVLGVLCFITWTQPVAVCVTSYVAVPATLLSLAGVVVHNVGPFHRKENTLLPLPKPVCLIDGYLRS
jgi:hypothetical protein